LLQAPTTAALRHMLRLALLLGLRRRLKIRTLRWVPDLACLHVMNAEVPDWGMVRLVLELVVLLVLLLLELLLLLVLLLVLLLLRRSQVLRRISVWLRRMPRHLLPRTLWYLARCSTGRPTRGERGCMRTEGG
jgi:hypothetical protein